MKKRLIIFAIATLLSSKITLPTTKNLFFENKSSKPFLIIAGEKGLLLNPKEKKMIKANYDTTDAEKEGFKKGTLLADKIIWTEMPEVITKGYKIRLSDPYHIRFYDQGQYQFKRHKGIAFYPNPSKEAGKVYYDAPSITNYRIHPNSSNEAGRAPYTGAHYKGAPYSHK